MQKIINGLLCKNKILLDDLLVNAKKSDALVPEAAKKLDYYGIVVINNFYDRTKAIELGYLLREIVKDARTELSNNEYLETPKYYSQIDNCRLKTYADIASAGKPVFNIRSKNNNGPDAGFIDFFSIDILCASNQLFVECLRTLRSNNVKDIIGSVSSYNARQVNLYFNESVRNTRGPHIDNLALTYKCFLYLGDVTSDSMGPYSYLPSSHKNAFIKKANIVVNKIMGRSRNTDIPMDRNALVKIHGDAGTLIISCQSGIHSGFPQKNGHERIVLVDNYY